MNQCVWCAHSVVSPGFPRKSTTTFFLTKPQPEGCATLVQPDPRLGVPLRHIGENHHVPYLQTIYHFDGIDRRNPKLHLNLRGVTVRTSHGIPFAVRVNLKYARRGIWLGKNR